jgi:hypothetical protein
MTDGQRYETIVRGFVWLLGLEHQLTMEPEAQIHTYEVLKLDEMQFMYTPGVEAHPPKVLIFSRVEHPSPPSLCYIGS